MHCSKRLTENRSGFSPRSTTLKEQQAQATRTCKGIHNQAHKHTRHVNMCTFIHHELSMRAIRSQVTLAVAKKTQVYHIKKERPRAYASSSTGTSIVVLDALSRSCVRLSTKLFLFYTQIAQRHVKLEENTLLLSHSGL